MTLRPARSAAPPHVPPLAPRRSAALETALARTDLWPVALAVFLLRGGIVVLLLPILVLPSTAGVATFVGPAAITPAGPAPSFLRLAVAAGALGLVWLVAGGLLAAWFERAFLRSTLEPSPDGPATGGEEPSLRPSHFAQAHPVEVPAPDAPGEPISSSRPGAGPRGPLRETLEVLGLRFVALVPLVAALAWIVPRVVALGYAELVRPTDLAVPLVLRVSLADPGLPIALIAGWAVSEGLGGAATRHLVLLGEGMRSALRASVVGLLRHPVGAVTGFGAGLLVAGVALAGPLVVAALSWGRLRIALADGRIDPVALGFTGVLVLAWGSGLVVAAAVATWRALAWTGAALPDGRSGATTAWTPSEALGRDARSPAGR